MAANANDLLIKTSEGTATTLSSPGYTIGNTSVTVVRRLTGLQTQVSSLQST